MRYSVLLLAGFLGSGAVAATQTRPVPINPRGWLAIKQDVPSGILKRGELVRTKMAIAVSPDGKVAGCNVVQSSGKAELDELACQPYLQRGRFRAARDAGGVDVAGTFTARRTWEAFETATDAQTSQASSARPAPDAPGWVTTDDLPPGILGRDEVAESDMLFTISKEGQATQCVVPEPSQLPQLDRLACQLIMGRGRFTPARDAAGQPVEGRYWSTIRWQVPKDATGKARRD